MTLGIIHQNQKCLQLAVSSDARLGSQMSAFLNSGSQTKVRGKANAVSIAVKTDDSFVYLRVKLIALVTYQFMHKAQ
jgi:hypothetical protein